MPKIISFANVTVRSFKECVNLYGNIINYGISFISNYEYIYNCVYKLLRRRYIIKSISQMLEDNIEVGKEYYFLSNPENLEEQAALIVALNLKKEVRELKRTIKFCTDLYRKNKSSFLNEKFILLLNKSA